MSPDAVAPPARLLPEQHPVRRGLACWALRRLGWRLEVRWPTAPKVVIIVYPHTSNWDFLLGYLVKLALGLPVTWIGKHTIFRWPLGPLLRWMGGVPVDREHAAGLIERLVAEFERRSTLCLALAPEGTRAYRDHVKSGFYRIALAARVPVGLAFFDFHERVVGLATWLDLTGEEEVDLGRIREAYAGRRGLHPGQASALRFKPEHGEGGLHPPG